MRYLELFARMLQSKAFRFLTRKTLVVLRYVFKHPFKTLWNVFRIYCVLLLAGLCITFLASKSFAADIYDMASGSVNASVTSQCETFPTLQEHLANINANNPSTSDTRYTDYSLENTDRTVREDGSCQDVYTFERTFQRYSPSIGWYSPSNNKQTTSATSYGSYEEAYQCPPQNTSSQDGTDYTEHTIMHTLDDGSTMCFTAQSLEDVDSCNLDNPDVIGTADSPPLVCVTKADGSKCAMQKYEVNGQFAYSQNLEPSSCYEGEISLQPYNDPTTADDITGDGCQEIGNGIRACVADPTQVCNQSTGVCNSGCGTFDIGQGPTFICLQDSDATCDPTTTANCIISEPFDPTTPYEPPIEPSDPTFQTVTGTNTLINNTNVILTGIGQGISTMGQGLDGVKSGLDEIKEEMETTKTVTFDDEIYTPNDYEERNYGTVLESAVNEMRNTELVTSVNEFFDVDFSGSCPIYSTSVPYINSTITIDQFCSSAMGSIWPIVSAIILLVFSVLAFRVAIL